MGQTSFANLPGRPKKKSIGGDGAKDLEGILRWMIKDVKNVVQLRHGRICGLETGT